MKGKKLLKVAGSVGLILILIGLLVACGPKPTPTPTTEPIELTCVTFLPQDDMSIDGFWHWFDLVNERAEGELVIKYSGGPEAIPMFDQHLAVMDGVVDICCTPAQYYSGLLPAGVIPGLSHLTAKEERENSEWWSYWQGEHHRVGMHLLCRTCGGYGMYMYSNVKIENPREDFKGLKFRSVPNADPFLKALGVATVTTPMTEVYSALERGIIDGYSYSPTAIITQGLHEVTKYAISHSFQCGALFAVINLDTWNSLPKHLQDLMTEAAIETEDWMWEYYGSAVKSDNEEMRAAGMEFLVFSPDDAKWFVNLAYETSWAEILKGNPELAWVKETLSKPGFTGW